MGDVERVWLQMVGACRARILSIPSKIAPIVYAAESVDSASSILEVSLHEALNELATNGIPADSLDSDIGAEADGESSTRNDQGTAETDSKPVGGRKKKTKPGSES